ncbi:hypothetical protein MKX59_19455 [Paenibacillus sp. FSL R7-0340]|uniref:hypothetical protein n=1 Tax=Paenibacillus sp. FSL R7-0340 TaxID=2921684 RepID=UPI0030F61DE2
MQVDTVTEANFSKSLLNIGFDRLPDYVRATADYEVKPDFTADKAIDGITDTYWTSGLFTGAGNLTLYFQGHPQSISVLRIKTGYFVPKSAVFQIYAKKSISDNQWIDVGRASVQINAMDIRYPQTVDISILHDSYEVVRIQCEGVPVINEIETL